MHRIFVSVCSIATYIHLVAAAVADPVLTPVPPFAGSYSEGFESLNGDLCIVPCHTSGPIAILGGQATMFGENPSNFTIGPLYVWNSLGGFGLGSNGLGVPFDGTHGLTLQTDYRFYTPMARLEFVTPIREFGGYWAHALTDDRGGPVHFRFFDTSNSVVATADFVYNTLLQGVHEWRGWQSTAPISAVEFEGFWPSVDGVQIVLVPEPSTIVLGLFGVVAAAVARRRLAA